VRVDLLAVLVHRGGREAGLASLLQLRGLAELIAALERVA
jgi:hypothetical protein